MTAAVCDNVFRLLRAGELCEYGEPYQLLSDPNCSTLLRLVDQYWSCGCSETQEYGIHCS